MSSEHSTRVRDQFTVLLIGNYGADKQQSMLRFAQLLGAEIAQSTIIQPTEILGTGVRLNGTPSKWLAYLDKFVIFPVLLIWRARRYDLIHICDQGNALYGAFLRWKPIVVTCHDVLQIESARGRHHSRPVLALGRIFQKLIFAGLRRASRIVCVSNETARRLIALGQIDPSRVVVIENGLNYPYRAMTPSDAWHRLKRMGMENNQGFLLHVGGNQWYKNRIGVIRIFAEIISKAGTPRLNLVLAGKQLTKEMRNEISHLGLSESVYEYVDVAEEDLRALYSVATALIFPSFEEGFGWPITEAQACGCPVFASRREPLISVGGAAAAYFEPENVTEAADIVIQGLQNSDTMRVKGFENAARFSPGRMGAAYEREYRRVLDFKICE